MKKFIIPVLIVSFSLLSVNNSFSQLQFFDSVKTVVSSPVYDYKNPVFRNLEATTGNFSWLIYERHNGSSSDIIIRKAYYNSYDSEIVITNTANALNINPAIDNDILVWQSNARGNWDLFYSVFTNGSWSPPVLMDSSTADETSPYIHNNKLGPEQYNYYYLAYKRNNSIRFKKFKTTNGIWNNDTLVTDGTNEDINPVISKRDGSTQFGIVFQRKLSGSVSKLYQRLFNENLTNTPIVWDSVSGIYQPNSQNNLSISFANSEFIIYSYDTLNSTHMLGFNLGYPDSKEVITKNVTGRHFSGKGSLQELITDNNAYYFFSVFSVISRNSDSLCFTFINMPASFNQNPAYKKLYLGDTNLVIKFDVSQPIFLQNYFRIKTVWEKTNGNRTELVESYMTDLLSSIINVNSDAKGFHLAQNYPNPFNPSTVIRYSIPSDAIVQASDVKLVVYDNLGKEVSTLVNEIQNAGNYEVNFDGSNISSGIYFYKLEAGSFIQTKKMLLLK